VVSLSLHRKWAERLRIDLRISRAVDTVIDEVQPDRLPGDVVQRLEDLRARGERDFDRALVLHALLDKLRDFMARLVGGMRGEAAEFLARAKPGVLLDVAKMLVVDTGRVEFTMLSVLDEVVEELKPHARELAMDVLQELRPAAREGPLVFGRQWKKYLRYIVERVPEFKCFISEPLY